MDRVKPNRIHIIGPVGSGKSTLARNLSSSLDIPYYELDNIVWRRTEGGDVRNSVEDRDRILNNILASDKWIIEGVHHKWVMQSFEQAEMIMYLDTHIWKRNYRIFKRFAVQKLGLQKGNYKQSFEMLKKMYIWNYGHQQKERPEIFAALKPYQDKLLVLRDNSDLHKHIKL